MTHNLPLPDFTHERVEVITGTAERTVHRRRAAFLRPRLRPRRRAPVDLRPLERRARRRPAPLGRDDAEERRGRSRRGRRQGRHPARAGHDTRRRAPPRRLPRPRRCRRVTARAVPHGRGRRLDHRRHADRQRAHGARRRPARCRGRLRRAGRPHEPRRLRVAARDARARHRLSRCRRSPHHDLGPRPGRQPPRRPPLGRGRAARPSRTSTPPSATSRSSSAPQWSEPGTEHLVAADVFVPAGIGGRPDRRRHRRARRQGRVRSGEQPAGRARRRRPARGARHPVRTRLRRQCGRRHLPRPRGEEARHARPRSWIASRPSATPCAASSTRRRTAESPRWRPRRSSPPNASTPAGTAPTPSPDPRAVRLIDTLRLSATAHGTQSRCIAVRHARMEPLRHRRRRAAR